MGLSATLGPAWCQVITGRLSVITAPSVFVCLRLTSVCTPLGRCREVGGERHAAQGGTASGALGQSTPPPPLVTCVCVEGGYTYFEQLPPPPPPPPPHDSFSGTSFAAFYATSTPHKGFPECFDAAAIAK